MILRKVKKHFYEVKDRIRSNKILFKVQFGFKRQAEEKILMQNQLKWINKKILLKNIKLLEHDKSLNLFLEQVTIKFIPERINVNGLLIKFKDSNELRK